MVFREGCFLSNQDPHDDQAKKIPGGTDLLFERASLVTPLHAFALGPRSSSNLETPE
jgi:hypothetical protein